MKKAQKRYDPKGRLLKEGEFYRNSDGLYVFRWTSGGVRQQITAKNLVDLREREANIKRDLLDGLRVGEAKKITLNMLFDEFMEQKKKTVRPNTSDSYKSTWKSCVQDRIGNMPIVEIRTSTLKKLFAELVDENRSKSCIDLSRKLISSCLDAAVADELLRRNAADKVGRINGGTVKRIAALTRDQQDALVEYAKSGAYVIQSPFLEFALLTGMRCGELCALQWSDIDYEAGFIHVTKQLQVINGENGKEKRIVPPKTRAGVRDIPIDDDVRHILTRQKKLYVQFGIRCKQEVDGLSDFVFLGMNGLPRNHHSVDWFLRRLVDAYNRDEQKKAKAEGRKPELMPKVSAHVLRHSAITNWANADDVDPLMLQSIAGHEHVRLTYDVYSDADKARIKEKYLKMRQGMKTKEAENTEAGKDGQSAM